MTVRCFVAVELSQEVRDAVAGLVGPMKKLIPGARWVRPEAMHITLNFLGEIQEDQVAQLGSALPAVCDVGSFQLRLRGLGAFPHAGSARVLWAGVAEGGRELSALAFSVNAVAVQHRVGENGRPTHVPHLTLARFPVPCDLSRIAVFDKARETEMGVCVIHQVVLFRSRLGSGGPVYDPLHRYALSQVS